MLRVTITVVTICLILLAVPLEAGESPWVQIAQLFGSDTDSQDSFGESVAIDGDTLVVAAYRKADGAVYIFERSAEPPTEWLETKKLSPEPGDSAFGLLVAISGDTLAVRAQANNGEALYLFERDFGGEDAWGLVGRFQGEDVSSLGLDGDTLGVGDRDFDLDLNLRVGAVYVLERGPGGPTDWRFVTTLTASDAEAQDHFGDTQALSGDHLLIGVPSEDDFGDKSGAAYIFERDEGEWTEVAKLLQPEPQAFDDFGRAVDLDVDTALVGNDGTIGTEGAFVYERDAAGNWVFVTDLRPSEGGSQGFGKAVGLSGSVAAVGAGGHDLPDVDGAGAVFVYERDAGGTDAWGEVAILLAADPQDADRLGEKLALDRNTLVVGVDEDDDRGFDAGTVYLFSRTELLLSVVGSCPGEMAVSVIGATPSGRVVLLVAQSEGVTSIPVGPCVGTEVGLDLPKVVLITPATSGGDLAFTSEIGAGVCGRHLQAVDVDSCLTSNVVTVP